MSLRIILSALLVSVATASVSSPANAEAFLPIERKISTFSIRVTKTGYEHFGPGQTIPPGSLPAKIIALDGRSSSEIWMLTDTGTVLRDDGKSLTFRQANPCGWGKGQREYSGYGDRLYNIVADKDHVHVIGEHRGIDTRVGSERRASLTQNGKWICTDQSLVPDIMQSSNGMTWFAAHNMDGDACRISSASGFCTSGPRFSPTHIEPSRDSTDMGIYNAALWMRGTDDGWVVTSDETFHPKLHRFNGVTWAPVAKIPDGLRISSIWADDHELWLTARSGSSWESPSETILRSDGKTLTQLNLPAPMQIRWVRGAGPRDVWFGGYDETIYQWDGKMRAGKVPGEVNDIWVAPDGAVFFVIPEAIAVIAPNGVSR